MGPEDFNPRGSRVFKKDLVQFLKEIDSSIHLPSSISKKGLIQLVEKRLGRASVAPATSRILRQRSNSPVLEITPSTVSTSPSDVGMTSIPAADPQSGKPPSIKPRKSPSIEQVKQTSVITSNLVATSPTPQPSNNTTAAITRMNVGRQWCYLEPKDPNVEPTISRLQVGREWCYIQQGQAGIISKSEIPTTPESAVAVGSIYYWDPKDNTKHSIFSDCSRPNLLSECTEKIDQWSIIDASDAASEPDNSPSPIITNHTPENIVEIHNELTVPGAFPIQIDSLIYPPSHSFTGMSNV
ncbi:hypothetical protein Pst134EA_002529 [Puccinia striiformis f. sp. tritici]|uniref:hypothetical protein n=1 Tax=Puccinia striiformis f. sp. tritici TaxID=168172 RepID=UPI002007EA01|nr:hypothetical protein Pst134EA_025402 [Puccinia striiformis f. sp. tritici]XP_047811352.1 hypothetical protein Pst134EA_002529 [Puccinia striiformis f. sp. tritici]KAH9451448.1 hypothetical protein Pst134EA_025402 [Puccinia striiformis f. sp. tritici]KAH9471898.1 hypothetical protein Pst134EA_002529 [Puccinia striiformis f. sp. tritici]